MQSPRKLPLKYYPTLGLYKASNVTYDPSSRLAHSYGWWQFVKVIGGRTIFNNYRYSVTTAAHQRKVRALMDILGDQYEMVCVNNRGLTDITTLNQLSKACLETAKDLKEHEETKRLERNRKAREARKARRQFEAAHTLRNLLSDAVVVHA